MGTTDSTATDTLPMVPTHTLMEATAPTDTHTPMAMAWDTTMATTCTRGRPKLRPSLRLILTTSTMATMALHTDTHMAHTATHTDMVPTDTHTATEDTTTRLLKSLPFDLIIPRKTPSK